MGLFLRASAWVGMAMVLAMTGAPASAESASDLPKAGAEATVEAPPLPAGDRQAKTIDPARIEAAVRDVSDLRPAAILRDLELRQPIYRQTAAYGHFGRELDGFNWERRDRVDDVKSALGL